MYAGGLYFLYVVCIFCVEVICILCVEVFVSSVWRQFVPCVWRWFVSSVRGGGLYSVLRSPLTIFPSEVAVGDVVTNYVK